MMPKPYKDTSKATNTPQTPKKGQNERQTQVTLADVINSILTFVLLAGALFIFALFLPQKAHSYASLTNYPAKQVKNNLPLVASIGQNKDLSNQKSGKPNRYLLAFFVPSHRFTSQVSDTHSTAPLTHFTGLNRHIYANSVTSYGGVTLQNKSLRQICKAVSFLTESEPRHPIPINHTLSAYNVALTQNKKGVANNG